MKTNHIRKTIILFTVSFSLLFTSGCTDFEKLNSNPDVATTINPNAQLSYVQLCMGGDWLAAQPFAYYYSGFIQHLQGDWSSTHYGGEYLIEDAQFQQPWDRMYTRHLKNLVDAIWRTDGDETYKNVNAVSRIIRVYYFLILTDMYGDIPYSEACAGYINGNVAPRFDTQEEIYKDMFKELTEAETQLDPAGDVITGDIIYGGNINKWKAYANTLALRIAMRLVKVEPMLAEDWVSEVLERSSGLIGNNDDGIIKYKDMLDWDGEEFRRNGLAQLWRSRENYPMCYFCTSLWNYMKNTNDPRLLVISRCYAEDSTDPANRTDLTDFIIMNAPGGMAQIEPVKPGFYWWDNWPAGFMYEGTYYGKECRPQLNKAFIKGSSPFVSLSYAEKEFLLAEAKVRWNSLSGLQEAEVHYKNGVKAAISLLKKFEMEQTISDSQVNTYLAANPFPTTKEEQLRVINEQLWILHLINPAEAFANWRRTGYPVLKSSVEYGAVTIDSRTIPRRLKYPLFEQTYNPKGYYEALSRMGGVDSWNNRVWWDKEN